MKPLTISVVSHTHWDREWYHSAGEFRQRLVALVDALVAEETGVRVPFLLDGQAVVLEDYLHVRPEQRDRVRTLLQCGAIEAGPWYVLADGLIPSAEALIRNLQAGQRVMRRLNAKSPPVAYCPDTFGHSHAIPTIARGFGFPLAIAWRGYGGARAPQGDTVRWASENGEEVVLYHLPPDGYETGSALPATYELAERRWKQLQDVVVPRANAGVVYLPNGADHHALQPDIAQAIAMLRRVSAPHTVVQESLSQFAERLLGEIKSRQLRLPVVRGELRDSYGYTWTLNGTFGTRAHQKRDNARAERLLLRDVEPWLALAWLHGGAESRTLSSAGQVNMVQAPALLDAAWRDLLRAHPHDTLCGCSIDAVARAMDVRVESAVLQARALRERALDLALRYDPVVARTEGLTRLPLVVVRNRSPYPRSGVAELVVDQTIRDVSVGIGSAAVGAGGAEPIDEDDAVRNALGDGMVVQRVRTKEVFRRRESPQHYPDNDLVREHRVLAWLPEVSPLGLRILGRGPSAKEAPANPVSLAVDEDGVEIGNALVSVRAGTDGVQLKLSGTSSGEGATGNRPRVIPDALTFSTFTDIGDSYTPAIRGEGETLRIVSIRRGLEGPLRASAIVRFETRGRKDRIRVVATISVDANCDVVRVAITGDNQRKDHRLRLNFHCDVAGASRDVRTFADAAFGPVARDPIVIPETDQAREMVPSAMPMHRWATMCGVNAGATLHSDGLAEAEADASSGVFSLTLVRSIGELSRNDLPERPGHAGWPVPIPLAQSIGKFHSRVGLQLHGGWNAKTRDAIEHANDTLLLPLVGYTMRDLRQTESEIAGPQLSGDGLRFSSATLSENGDGVVLRCVNDADTEATGRWTIPSTFRTEFVLARIDETPLGHWQPVAETIAFTAPPRGVVTIRVRQRVP